MIHIETDSNISKKIIYIDELDLKKKKINYKKSCKSKSIKIETIKKLLLDKNKLDKFLNNLYESDLVLLNNLYLSCSNYEKNNNA